MFNKRWALFFCLAVALTSCSSSQETTGGDGGPDQGGSTTAGKVSKITGTPGGRGAADGVAEEARFWTIMGVAGDSKVLYLADYGNGAIRKLDLATGKVTTLAGDLGGATVGSAKDGTGSAATFSAPTGVALVGPSLYVADGRRLRKVDIATGQVTTVKDSSGQPWAPKLSATIIAVDVAAAGGKLYVSEGTALGQLDLQTGAYEIFAGGKEMASTDGKGLAARFKDIAGVAAAGADTLYVTDQCLVRKVSLKDAQVTTLAGKTLQGDCVVGTSDGVGTAAEFQLLWGITYDGKDIHVLEYPTAMTTDQLSPNWIRVRRVDPVTGQVTTVAGTFPTTMAQVGERDGAADEARMYYYRPIHAAGGALYLGGHAAVRRLEGGQVSTVAGALFSDPFRGPEGIATDETHAYTILDSRNELSRVELASGASESLYRFSASTTLLTKTWDMVRRDKTLYVAATQGLIAFDLTTKQHQVLLPSPAVGSYYAGLADDGQFLYLAHFSLGAKPTLKILKLDPTAPSEQQTLCTTTELAFASTMTLAGKHLYLQQPTHLVKIALSDGTISTVAGDPNSQGCQAGTGSAARFRYLVGVGTDGEHVYLGDSSCHTIWKLDPATGEVSALAGSPSLGVFKAGQGAAAGINYPKFLVYDKRLEALVVSDSAENVIFSVSL